MSKDSSLGRSTRSTMMVSGLTMISRILGFVRTAVISAVFGASGMADVINLTFNIPNNFRKLLAEGALSASFIPVLSESIVHDDGGGKEPRRIVRNILTFQLIILIPLCVGCIIFARPLVGGILAHFSEPWQQELSANLFRWFINYLLLISVSAAIMGALNSHSRFFVPALTPLLFSVFVISSILLLQPVMGPYAMVAGVLLGGVGQIVFQTPSFLRLGYDFKPNFRFNHPSFRRIMKQWGPVVITSSVFTITQVVAYRLASALEEGSTSALSYAVVFWQLPMGIFSASITTVLFPKMSRQSAREDFRGLRESLRYGIRFMAVFLIPSAVYLLLFGGETIAIALQRGRFTAENSIMTAKVLAAYSMGLFSVGVFNFSQRFFYSLKEYRIPFWVSLFTGVLDVALSLILKETSLRVSGLALANTISFTLGAAIFLFLAKRRLGTLGGREIAGTLLKVGVSCMVMAFFIIQYKALMGPWIQETQGLTALIKFIGGTIGSGVIVLLLYKLFKIEMLDHLLKRRKGKQ